MTATAVCGDCNAVVGFDVASCSECGRVFPRAARPRKGDEPERIQSHVGMMLMASIAVTGLSMLVWREPENTWNAGYLSLVLAAAMTPLGFARLGLKHSIAAAWLAFAIALVGLNAWRVVHVGDRVEVQRAEQAATAEFEDALRQLRERHRLFLTRAETGELLAGGSAPEVRAATSKNDMHLLLAELLRASSDRAMQLHVAWQEGVDKLNQGAEPSMLTTRNGLDTLRHAAKKYRTANATLAEQEQALRVELLAQARTIIGGRPERDALLERIESDIQLRGAHMVRLAELQEKRLVLVDDVIAFMAPSPAGCRAAATCCCSTARRTCAPCSR